MLVNAWLAQKWLGLEYTQARGSIEWVYIALARYIGAHGLSTIYGNAEWFPYWYGGVPFENAYPPLLHYLTAIVAKLAHLSPGRAYHLVTGFFFCLGPLSVFALARRCTRALLPSLAAAVFYSLLSPCSWLMPSIAGDLNGYTFSQRYSVLFTYGEGPHLASLALMPLAMLALDRALERFTWRRVALAALACAVVPLSNIIGGFALAWGVLAVTAVHGWHKAPRALAIGAWAYLLSLRWLQPAMLADIQRNAPFLGSFPMDRWHYLALAELAALSVAVVYALRRRPGLAMAVGFLLPMAAIPLAWEYQQYYFLPQPHRYHLEMDLGIALLLAVGLAKLPRGQVVAGVALAGLTVFGALHGRDLDRYVQPLKLEETWEHRITRFMANYGGDARVYFQGTPRFFAGVEYDQAQFGGGFANGARWPLFFEVDFGVTAYKGGAAIPAAWLNAYGVDFVAVGDKDTKDPFKPWLAPHQFDGLLTEVWREQGDAIFEVNRSNQSLAHVIPRDLLVEHKPQSFTDTDELFRYVAAIEGPASKGGVLTWTSPSNARIEGEMSVGDAVSVQVAYDKRWRASVKGKAWPVREDGLGNLWIEAQAGGAPVIELEFRQPKIIFLLCGTAWLVCLGGLIGFEFRRREFGGGLPGQPPEAESAPR